MYFSGVARWWWGGSSDQEHENQFGACEKCTPAGPTQTHHENLHFDEIVRRFICALNFEKLWATMLLMDTDPPGIPAWLSVYRTGSVFSVPPRSPGMDNELYLHFLCIFVYFCTYYILFPSPAQIFLLVVHSNKNKKYLLSVHVPGHLHMLVSFHYDCTSLTRLP